VTYLEIDNGGPLVNFTNGYNLVGARTALATDIVLSCPRGDSRHWTKFHLPNVGRPLSPTGRAVTTKGKASHGSNGDWGFRAAVLVSACA
jgi:hypothetical protein